MPKRLSLSILVLVMLSIVLTACATDASVENAQNFMDAMGRQDLETARQYVCNDELPSFDTDMAPLMVYAGEASDDRVTYRFENIDCQAEGIDVSCTVDVVTESFGTTNSAAVIYIFAVENDKVCGIKAP